MRIQPISNHTAFQGLLGSTRKLVDTQIMYGHDYDCMYYDQYYYPFADETPREIEHNMRELENALNEQSKRDIPHCFSGDYISLRLGRTLNMKKSDYELLCNGVIPPALDKII